MYKILFFVFSIQLAFGFTDPSIIKKIDPLVIKNYTQKESAEYIVLFKDRLVYSKSLALRTKNEKARYVYETLFNHAKKTQRKVVSFLSNKNIPFQSFYVINAIKVTSDEVTMMTLAEMDEVERIIDDTPMKMLDYESEKVTSARTAEPEWGLKYIKADSVWAKGFTGQGVIIGGQDTGYDWQVSPLKQKYRGYIDSTSATHDYNWHDAIIKNNPIFPDTILNPCGLSVKQPCDDNNHGTHTMGTMVGEDTDNKIGVAPGAKWIACRNMDRGWGQPSTYIDCFEWFLAPKDLNGLNPNPTKAPHVINNSWYCSREEGCNESNFLLMEEVVKNVKASGIVVVVSAGNSGNGCGSVSGPPAFFESSLSIGATDINGNIAGFSSRGPVMIDSSFRLKPNVSAPGVNVRSVIRGGSFAGFNGTSMAGPHVAGIVALIISANPALAGNVDVIEDIIEGSAIPTVSEMSCSNFDGASVPNAVFGYGIANALQAVNRALEFNTNILENEPSSIKVFPNPTDELLTFVIENGNEVMENIEIIDLSGRVVIVMEQRKNLMYTMPVASLESGIYFYQVKTNQQTMVGKFVKL